METKSTKELKQTFTKNLKRLCDKHGEPPRLTETQRKRLWEWRKNGLARPDHRTRPLLNRLAKFFQLQSYEYLWRDDLDIVLKEQPEIDAVENAFRNVVLQCLQNLESPYLGRLGLELDNEDELHELWRNYISKHWEQTAKDFVARYVLDLLYLNGCNIGESGLANTFIRRLNQAVLELHPINQAVDATGEVPHKPQKRTSLAGVTKGPELLDYLSTNHPDFLQKLIDNVWIDDEDNTPISPEKMARLHMELADGDPLRAIDQMEQSLKDSQSKKPQEAEPESDVGDLKDMSEEAQGAGRISRHILKVISKDWGVDLGVSKEEILQAVNGVAGEDDAYTAGVNLAMDKMMDANPPAEKIQEFRTEMEKTGRTDLLQHPLLQGNQAAPEVLRGSNLLNP